MREAFITLTRSSHLFFLLILLPPTGVLGETYMLPHQIMKVEAALKVRVNQCGLVFSVIDS